MRRFKDEKRADSPAQAVELLDALTAEAPAEAPAGAQEDAAPAKTKFNHAYLIFNPAAGQENPVSSRLCQAGTHGRRAPLGMASLLHSECCT